MKCLHLWLRLLHLLSKHLLLRQLLKLLLLLLRHLLPQLSMHLRQLLKLQPVNHV